MRTNKHSSASRSILFSLSALQPRSKTGMCKAPIGAPATDAGRHRTHVRTSGHGGNFRVNNQNMGMDPAVGRGQDPAHHRPRPRGAVRTFTYREGATVNSRTIRSLERSGGGGWNGGGTHSFGSCRRTTAHLAARGNRNVTQRLQGMIRNNIGWILR